MGSVGSQIRAVSSSKMKFLAVAVALVAGVSAEADADAFYSPYALPYAYGAYTFGGKCAPLAYHGYPYAYYGKRDAEPTADAEADPALFYGAYGYPYGLGYGYAYGGYGLPVAAYGGVAATNPTLGHAVVYTPAGVTHSSNVGVCTNYLGAQVPC